GRRAGAGGVAGAGRLAGAGRVAGAVTAILLVVALISTAASFPDSIAWTSWPFRPNYAVATDSDVDWGQGLYALRSWSASRDPWVGYFGPRGITTADIPGARPLLGTAPGRISGWVAVSVTTVNSANRSAVSWLRGWCPVAILAGSVLIYHFSQTPAASPAPAARPAPLCPGQWSSAR
ncbi:MAG: hypothetical protein M3Z75_13345, partial [Actinomycetota bacterium]|nr:hypothetical protein [Actinomycetota bacterium]